MNDDSQPSGQASEIQVWLVAGVREFGRFTPEDIFEDESDAKNDIYNEECDGACIIPVVPKSALDAATARAEQAEAACGEMRAAIAETIKVEDVPGARMSSLVCFLEGIAEGASDGLFIDRSMAELYAKRLRQALSSDSGKSTADELRRLREENLLVGDLAMLVRRLLRKVDKESQLYAQATDFLKRKGLQGSILRSEAEA